MQSHLPIRGLLEQDYASVYVNLIAPTSDNYVDRRLQMFDFVRYAQQGERWEDMINVMASIVLMDRKHTSDHGEIIVLSQDELHFLTVAFKQSTATRRTLWRTLSCEEAKANETVQTYAQEIKNEIASFCEIFLDLLVNYLIPAQRTAIDLAKEYKPNQVELVTLHPNTPNGPNLSPEEILSLSLQLHKQTLVLFLKLVGDYNRYLSELHLGESGHGPVAKDAYHEAFMLAKSTVILGSSTEVLPRVHPIRLGLALNYSVCFYEILDERERACAIAKEAFDSALTNLGHLDENPYKDATLILALLRDNLTLWSEVVNESHDRDDYDDDADFDLGWGVE